ncbi:MAG: DUF1553 domain-containing protein [Planctomycetota bacterium]|nr:MAG: DUF1553 domain-containing protein [Planctomycetota bacterium]
MSRFLLACLLGAAAAHAVAQGTDTVDFSRQIRPILSDRCFACHGPDEKSRKAKLRLDTFAGATRDLGGYRAIHPGKPEESELLIRLREHDIRDRMPPQSSNLTVSAEEIALLERWIEQGAEYTQHWAFLPPRRVPTPTVADESRILDPLDRFVWASLERDGKKPAPPADRATWLRRTSFALTGISPTPEELAEFVADSRPDAFERCVDRLLASPRFGERMAQDWLDVARYADTYGYQADADRRVWPYRDWVIRAFNDNLPYDDFLTWQLAGDLLPNPTRDQRLATAFNRLHRQTNEGGSVEEEFRVEYVADRTETAGTAFLGLTLNCAQCHDHKFDPIKQSDFYRLAAFFDKIDESGLYSHFTPAVPTPTLRLSSEAQDRQLNELREKILETRQSLEATVAARTADFEQWLATKPKIAIHGRIAYYTLDDFDLGLANQVAPENKEQRANSFDGPKIVDGVQGQGVLLDGEDNLSFPLGAFQRTDAFSIALWLRVSAKLPRAVVFHRSKAWTDAGSQGYQMLLEDGRPSASLIHFWPGNAIRIRTVEPLPLDRWVHLVMTYDGSSRAAGLRIYQDGKPAATTVVRDQLYKHIRYDHPLTIGQRFRDNGLKGGAVDEFQIFDRELSAIEVAELWQPGAAPPTREQFRDYYFAKVDELSLAHRTELANHYKALAELENSIPEIMAMEERAEIRQTFVLARGSYEQRTTPVEAGTPASLPPFPADAPRNRLGLARWLTQKDHPLTARVAVNRLWHLVFGRGLVPTLENFGSQGTAPSHPKLLDFLAFEFVESGWDIKAMMKRLVLSATFRQSSSKAPGRVSDPENAALARGPSFRLSAEMLRDHALHVSGLLVEKVGGPSVKPYQPPGLWKEKSGKVYQPSQGEGLYRRSLYTFWKRTSPPPSMMIFDAAKRDVCVARRQVTNTPLQALVLLNDPQFVEAARVLATRVLKEHASPEKRIESAFQRLTSRQPTSAESTALHSLLDSQLARFRQDEAEAQRLLAIGESEIAKEMDQATLAAYTVVCSTILNCDAAVTAR